MVRRLVQEQKIGPLQDELGDLQPAALAAAQAAHLLQPGLVIAEEKFSQEGHRFIFVYRLGLAHSFQGVSPAANP